jgi:hypothetical protein
MTVFPLLSPLVSGDVASPSLLDPSFYDSIRISDPYETHEAERRFESAHDLVSVKKPERATTLRSGFVTVPVGPGTFVNLSACGSCYGLYSAASHAAPTGDSLFLGSRLQNVLSESLRVYYVISRNRRRDLPESHSHKGIILFPFLYQ